MIKLIDNFLNKITMYRLTQYCLIYIWLFGLVLSVLNILPYAPLDFIFSGLVIFIVCFFTNTLFVYFFKAPSNVESVYITAFILMLLISPQKPLDHIYFLVLSSILAIASKYILAINKKHIFNPAAFGVAAAAFLINQYAVWWIGTLYMAPIVLVCGFLIVRKIQRADLVLSFFITSIILTAGYSFFHNQNVPFILKQVIIDSPWMFLAFVMLTEPMTTPPKKSFRITYGMFVGFLFAPFVHLGNFYFSPELALLTGNIFSYIVSPKEKLILTLKEKIKIATNTFDFIFLSNKKLKFIPGQYMEWTLYHTNQDNRGIRRYFTVASSPTESEIRIGVKFYEKSSSYKKTLESLNVNDKIVASQLAGDFTLPKDRNKKLIFLAGGIGITPFRSMVKYLIDNNEKRDIIIFYANKSFSDIAYKEVFDMAQKNLGITTIYTLSDLNDIPLHFNCEIGLINKEMILEKAKDYKERMFYISGPKSMIDSFDKTLKEMGINKNQIKTDFFPGFV